MVGRGKHWAICYKDGTVAYSDCNRAHIYGIYVLNSLGAMS